MVEHECEDCDGSCDHEHGNSHNINEFDEETQRQIQEMQILEQNFQQILMQKQAFTMELNETDFALEEVTKSDGEIFKIVGNQVVIKTSKDKLTEELKHKKGLIELRLTSLDKQEKEFTQKIESIIKKIQNNQ